MAAGAVLNLTSLLPASFPPAGADRDTVHFGIEVELDSLEVDHADDAVLVFQFPPVAYIHNVDEVFNMAILTDAELDTDAVETLELDLGIGGVDGVADYLLISGASSTIAEVGGCDTSTGLVAVGSPCWIDVGDLYLQIIVRTVAATPADGSVYVGGWYTQNLVQATVTSSNL